MMKDFGCQIREFTLLDIPRYLHHVNPAYRFQVFATLVTDELVILFFVDWVFQTARFVVPYQHYAEMANKFCLDMHERKLPLIIKPTFVIDPDAQWSGRSLCAISRWPFFAAKLTLTALAGDCELLPILQGVEEGRKTNYLKFENQLMFYEPSLENVNTNRNTCLIKQNLNMRHQWTLFLSELDLESCSSYSWAPTQEEYEEATTTIANAFGTFLDEANFKQYCDTLVAYSDMEMEEFTTKFSANSVVPFYFCNPAAPNIFFNLIQVAQIVAFLNVEMPLIFQSLIGEEFILRYKKQDFLEEFNKNPNIFRFLLPYKVILHFYWYLHQENSLPTYAPNCHTIFDKIKEPP